MTFKMEDKTNGMQDYEDDLSWVLAELAAIFTQSLGIFARSSDLLAQSTLF
jgi:hypothetical protein